MKVLLDEQLPKKLKQSLSEHEVYTVRDMRWEGTRNGELMRLIPNAGFQAFISMDRGIAHQHNSKLREKFAVLIIVATDNRLPTLLPIVPALLEALEKIEAGSLVYVPHQESELNQTESSDQSASEE